MKQARARLRVSRAGVEEAWAEAPQRWTLQQTAGDGWSEVAHQLLGEGAFGGDRTRTSIRVEEGGRAIVRAVAATPLRGNGVSTSAVRLRCESGGALVYLPGPL
ncbi:MAG: urease accessory protein UreD, partial [Tepidiformaceae bacterium]